MPNIATTLKLEISRVAKKELRGELTSLKKSASSHRSQLAALKRQVAVLEQSLGRLSKAKPPPSQPAEADAPVEGMRFSAKGLHSTRQRLGLSAEEVGTLVGASAQSVYNWESGKVRPRARHLPALVALRSIGKRQVRAALESIQGAASA